MSYGNRSGTSSGNYESRGFSSGGDRFGSSIGEAKPVEVGKEYNVDVTELSRRGDGVAKLQGFVIFVKGSKVGDSVKIKVESVGPRFATASVVPSASQSVTVTSTSTITNASA